MFTTGSQDCSLRLWEVSTARCMRTLKFKFPVRDVAWNPNSSYSTVAAAVYVFVVSDLFVQYEIFIDSKVEKICAISVSYLSVTVI